MANSFGIKLDGLADLNKLLESMAPASANNLVRATVYGIAQETRDRIEAAAPFKHLRRGFQVVRRRGEPGKPVSEVRAKAKASDWRWFEFGTQERYTKKPRRYAGRIVARPFVQPQVELLRAQLPDIYREQFGKKLGQQLARQARKATKQ